MLAQPGEWKGHSEKDGAVLPTGLFQQCPARVPVAPALPQSCLGTPAMEADDHGPPLEFCREWGWYSPAINKMQ